MSPQFSGLFPHGHIKAVAASVSMSEFEEGRKEKRVGGRRKGKEEWLTSAFMKKCECLPKAFPHVSLARISFFTHSFGSHSLVETFVQCFNNVRETKRREQRVFYNVQMV